MPNETAPVIFTSGYTVHPCDLCGSTQSTPIDAARPYVGNELPPVVCNQCGFVFVTHRRTSEEVASAWDGIWGAGYTSAWPAVKARLTYVAEWIDQNIGLKDKSVLDIGAGEGTFLEMVRDRGAAVMGIEPSEDNATRMSFGGIGCFAGTIEDAPVPLVTLGGEDRYYDIVTVNWTLENTGDCIGFLKKAREFLKPDGHLVVATGSRILVPFKKRLQDYFSTNPADTHCFRFSANSLIHALAHAELGVDHINRFQDSDWLVCAASYQYDDDPMNHGNVDDPAEVLEFFDNWSRSFP